MAVRFDTADDRLTDSDTYPQTSAGFTVTMWARIAVDQNAAQTFLRLSTGSGTIATLSTRTDGTTGPGYYHATMTSGCEFTDDMSSPATGVWVPIAMSRSADGATANVYRKVNGTAATTSDSLATSGSTGTPDQICIGGRRFTDATSWLNGAVAYVRIWSAPLTQAEIEAEWASAVPVRAAGLFEAWRLDTADDLTGVNGRVLATVSGSALTTEDGPFLKTGGAASTGAGSGAKTLVSATVHAKTGGAAPPSAGSGAKTVTSATVYSGTGGAAASLVGSGARSTASATTYDKAGGAAALGAGSDAGDSTVYVLTGGAALVAAGSGRRRVGGRLHAAAPITVGQFRSGTPMRR